MSRSSAGSRNPLVPVWAVGAFALTALVTLALLFPRNLVARREHHRPTTLSLLYERLLLARRPDDRALRLDLVRDAMAAGELELSSQTLAPLMTESAHAADVERLAFQLDLQRWREIDPHDERRPAVARELAGHLVEAAAHATAADELDTFADAALELQRPDVAAELYTRLAVELKPTELVQQSARKCAVVTGEGAPAGAGARCYATLALRAALAANGGADVVPLARRIVAHFPDDRDLLLEATEAVASTGETDTRLQWWRQEIVRHPDDADALQLLLPLELAGNHLGEAAEVSWKLVQLDPANEELRKKAAEIALWADRRALAIALWQPLADAGQPDAVEKVITLARGSFRPSLVCDLLKRVSARRALKKGELQALATAATQTFPPHLAAPLLEGIFRKGGAGRTLWEKVAALYESAEELPRAVAIHQLITTRFGAQPGDTIKQAELLWRDEKPDSALSLLRGGAAAGQAVSYWRTFGELAWQRESTADARRAYEALAKADALEDAEADRLIALRQEDGDATGGVSFAAERWRRKRDPHFLWLALDGALRADRWQTVRALVNEARNPELAPPESLRWWEILGELAVRDARWSEASAAFEKILEADPASVSTRARLLWLADVAGDRPREAELLARWRADADATPALWRAYATGLDHVGSVEDSLYWYAREAHAHPDDDLWVLSYADALTRTGDDESAEALRRYVYPHVIAAARAARTAQAGMPGALAVARADLVAEFSGRPVADAIAKTAIAQPDPLVRGYAAEWLVSRGQILEAQTVARTLTVAQRRGLPASVRLALAFAGQDPDGIEIVAEQVGAVLTPDERAQARRELEKGPGRLALAVEAIALAPPGSDAVQIARHIAGFDRSGGVVLVASASAQAWGAYGAARTGVDVSTQVSPFRFGATAGADDVWLPNSAPATGFDVGLHASWVSGASTTNVGGALDWRAGSSVWSFSADHHTHLGNGLTVGGTVLVNDVAGEWGALRASAARDWAGADATLALNGSTSVTTRIAAQRFTTRAGDPLSNGAHADAEVDVSPVRTMPALRLRATASAEVNVETVESSGAATLASWIPPQFAMGGAGISWASGDVEDERRRFAFVADGWAGWMWPLNRPAFRVSGGLGWRLTPGEQLMFDIFAASDEPLAATEFVGGVQLRLRTGLIP